VVQHLDEVLGSRKLEHMFQHCTLQVLCNLCLMSEEGEQLQVQLNSSGAHGLKY
jgi:hypothetical protein